MNLQNILLLKVVQQQIFYTDFLKILFLDSSINVDFHMYFSFLFDQNP